MKTAIVTLESLTPYSSSPRLRSEKEPKEDHLEFDQRVWRERIHTDSDGNAFVPPMAFKRSLEGSAKFLRIRIKGKGQSEYGKHFRSGVLVTEGMLLGIKAEDAEYEDQFVSSSGKPGEMNVMRRFPVFRKWKGVVTYHILDETIGEDVFNQHLIEAGNFIGIGRFRPQNGGYYGRYEVKKIKWS